MAGRRLARSALVVPMGMLAAMQLSGCSPSTLASASIASYTQSNAVIAAGYSEKQLDATHYEVRANGTEATPREHVQRIAMARAAEIGITERLPYFKVVNVTHGYVCTPKRAFQKGSVEASRYPPVSLDVVYARKASGPDFLKASDTFPQLKAEIDGAAVAPEATTAALEEIRAQCGTQ